MKKNITYKKNCIKLNKDDLDTLLTDYTWIPEDEEFRQIKGFEDYYVSQNGIVISCKTDRTIVLQQYINNTGYLYVTLCNRGISTKKYVHTLVAKAFLTNTYRRQHVEVHHIDKNKDNNSADNLMILSKAHHEIENHVKSIAIYMGRSDKFYYCKSITDCANKLQIDVKDLYSILQDKPFDKIHDFNCYAIQIKRKGITGYRLIGVKRTKSKKKSKKKNKTKKK